MKVPYDLDNFLSVGENKEELFKLIQRSVEKQSLGNKTVIFCYLNRCVSVSVDGAIDLSGLSSEYEEVDYMFVAYSVIEEGNIMIRSPSGDVDIIVMLIANLDKISATVYVDNGTGNNRKVLHLNSCTLSSEIRDAVIGLHAIS